MIPRILYSHNLFLPPDPTIPCRICECHVYSCDQLENGLCDICVEEYVCIECGEEMSGNQQTDKYGYCPECQHENA